MLTTFFRRLENRDVLGEQERAALEAATSTEKLVPAHEDAVSEGDHVDQSLLLVEGLAARYRLMEDGSRQISAFHVPGDFVDLFSFPLKVMDHAILAVAPCRFAVFPHDNLKVITREHPHLTRLLWLTTLLDSAIQREWLVGLGRRTAGQRAAHLFCEMGLRLDAVGMGEVDKFYFPATQADLADALGISVVHSNRVVQSLRATGLLEWQRGQVVLPDLVRLRQLARFDGRYLHLRSEPR